MIDLAPASVLWYTRAVSRVAAFVVGALALAGCEWNSVKPDDASTRIDARHHVDASDDAPFAATPHLLLTEVALTPTGAEFIELYNPTAQAIPLARYYLSDNGNYFALPLGSPLIGVSDFIVQFPAAASIAPGGVVTVATGTAAAFNTAFGKLPTYSIADDTVIRTLTSGTPSLTDAGEIVVLFQWDGAADLVKDVDMVIAGAATAANGLVSKSGLIQGANKMLVGLQ